MDAAVGVFTAALICIVDKMTVVFITSSLASRLLVTNTNNGAQNRRWEVYL
jgi:hypothetical protein